MKNKPRKLQNIFSKKNFLYHLAYIMLPKLKNLQKSIN